MKTRALFHLGCCAAALALCALARADDRAILTWAGFETDAEVARWQTLGTRFERATKFATEGQRSARLHFVRYAGAQGEDQWPRVTAFGDKGLYPTDWRNWAAVALDLATDAPQSVTISLEIRDTAGKNGWYTSYSIQPGAVLHVMVPLSEVSRTINVSHIAEFLLFKGRPEADVDVYVDNVRLITPAVLAMQQAVEGAAAAMGTLWRGNPGIAAHRAELDALRKAASAPRVTVAGAERVAAQARRLEAALRGLRVRPLRAFDFGPAGSPVREGFVGVSARSAFTAQAGFGWRQTDGLRENLAPAQREETESFYMGRKVPPAVYLNDVDQDLVGGAAPAEFVVSVPPGGYAVWLLAGFPAGYEPVVNNFAVDAGAGVRRIGLAQQHIFEPQVLQGRAGADGLVVRFTPETGFVVNALAVFPLKDARRARKEFIGPIEREIGQLPADLWAQWHLVPHAPERPAPPLAAEEQRRGYVLFTRPFVENIYPDSQPAPRERFRRLEAFATPGEYQPFTFAVQALRHLDGVSASADDLRGPGGARIPASRVDVR